MKFGNGLKQHEKIPKWSDMILEFTVDDKNLEGQILFYKNL